VDGGKEREKKKGKNRKKKINKEKEKVRCFTRMEISVWLADPPESSNFSLCVSSPAITWRHLQPSPC